MESVFVSYSHQDSEFTDRLIRDLRYSDVPATYDKWLLKVGDSIIDRIAEAVATAASVVAIVSSSSVASAWVRKELSLAMTREIHSRAVKVLPAVIDECDVPASISDKLYADFRRNYFWGLTKLLEALDPRERESRWESRFHSLGDTHLLGEQFEGVLGSGQMAVVKDWVQSSSHILLQLFGRRWALSESIRDFGFGRAREDIDFLVVNGQSFKFEFQAIRLGPVQWSSASVSEVQAQAEKLGQFVVSCRENYEEFCRAASIRFSETQIGPPAFVGYPDRFARRHEIRGTLLVGRRNDYRDEQERLRQETYERTNGLVEIASYDRLLDALAAQ
jgi:hypothetical protein